VFYFRVLFEQRRRDSSCSSTKPSLRRDRYDFPLLWRCNQLDRTLGQLERLNSEQY
jgi:hypothetical protein